MMFPIAILGIENEDDRVFMEKLYIDHRQLMFKLAFSVLHDFQDTEDAINTACVSLINNISLLRGFDSCTLRSYIVSTIRNTALNIVNKRNRIRTRSVADPESSFATIVSDEPEVDRRILQQSEIEGLKRALQKLPEREMSLLQMKYVMELPDDQIAKELGIKPASVRAYLTKARRLARKKYEENEE